MLLVFLAIKPLKLSIHFNQTYREFVDTRSAEVVANIVMCLIHQAHYLLDQQIRRLEKDFLKKVVCASE